MSAPFLTLEADLGSFSALLDKRLLTQEDMDNHNAAIAEQQRLQAAIVAEIDSAAPVVTTVSIADARKAWHDAVHNRKLGIKISKEYIAATKKKMNDGHAQMVRELDAEVAVKYDALKILLGR